MIRFCLLSVALTLAPAVVAQTLNDTDRNQVSTFRGHAALAPRVVAGSASFTGTEPVMSPRFFRSGVPGDPCQTFSSGNFQYVPVPMFSDASGSATANFDPGTCSSGIFVTFHTAPFNPADICQNFVWSFGSSAAFSETFTVPANTELTMVISGVANAPGVVCGPATYSVSGVNPPGGDLTLAVTDTPDPVTPGTAITYVATATNGGPADVTAVNISFPMAAGTTFTSATPSAGGTCTTPAAGSVGTVSCDWAGATAAGSANARSVTIVAGVPAATIAGANLVVNATTASTPPDFDTANNGATATTTVGAASSDLAAGLSVAPTVATAGTNLVYTATVSNLGPSAAQNAQISLALPTGTSFVAAAGTGATCSGTTTVVCVWAGATAPTATRTATVTAVVGGSVINGSSLTATNTVSSATTDPVGANNIASVATRAVAPIPVNNPLALALLALLLSGLGLVVVRRQG